MIYRYLLIGYFSRVPYPNGKNGKPVTATKLYFMNR